MSEPDSYAHRSPNGHPGTAHAREVLFDMASEEPSNAEIISDVDDFLLGPNCPLCDFPGLDYDKELGAWIHDFCGYYAEAPDPEDTELDDWLD